jgi:hypothetical protein
MRGKRMSIAKAALIAFKEGMSNGDDPGFIYTGDSNLIFRAIEIADPEKISFQPITSFFNSIRKSKYWEKSGEIPGWKNKKAGCWTPSLDGLDFIDSLDSLDS